MRHLTVQQLSASLDGTLSGVSLEMVTHHLATCRECRDRHAALAKQDETLRRLLAWAPAAQELEDMHIRLEAILDADARGAVPPAHAQVQAGTPAPKPVAPVPATAPVIAPPPAPVPVFAAPVPAQAPAPPPEPQPAPTPRTPRRPLPAWLKRGAAVVACLCALAIAAMIALPPVIRISVPKVPPLRVPRVEFEHASASPKQTPTPATHATPIPVVVVAPPETLRAPFVLAPSPAPRLAHPAHVPAHTPPRPAPSPARTPTPAPAPVHKPVAEPDDSASWPLLCGEVLDDAGQPVAGARVSLADLDLSARSDRKGHFCIAAPPGDRTLSVIAQGFATFRTVISLAPTGSDLHVSLKPAP